MFENSYLERVRQLFADQFEADGQGFLYRKNMKAAPIRVTASERDGFIAGFNRHLRYGMWAIFLATLLLIGMLVLLVPDPDSPSADMAMYGGMTATMIPFLLAYHWAWKAPARQLKYRTAIGQERTRSEVGRVMLAKTSYGQFAFAGLSAVLLIWRVSAQSDVRHGWGIVWLTLAVFIIVMVGIQAFRKWSSERR